MADEVDFNSQLEKFLDNVTRTVVLALKTPFLIVDLFRRSTMAMMLSETGIDQKYLGPQSVLVLAFILMVFNDFLPQQSILSQQHLLMQSVMEQERFHYLLEFFLWFTGFILIRTIVISILRLQGIEKRYFERILGYATAIPLLLFVAEMIIESWLTHIRWVHANTTIDGDMFSNQDLIVVTFLVCVAVAYPSGLIYLASNRLAYDQEVRPRRTFHTLLSFWRAAVGMISVVAAQALFAASPYLVQAILPKPLSLEVLDMYLTAKPTVPLKFPVGVLVKLTNRSDEDVFADVQNAMISERKYGNVSVAQPGSQLSYVKIGKNTSEIILFKRLMQAPEDARFWTIYVDVMSSSPQTMIENSEDFLFLPSMDRCYGNNVRVDHCAAPFVPQ